MGEISDMMIDGTLDAETGEFLDGDAPGFPRVRRKGRIVGQFDGVVVHLCPTCNKRCKSEQGVTDHVRAKHQELR